MRIIIVLLALLISGNAYAQIKKPSDVIRDLSQRNDINNPARPAAESFPGIGSPDDLVDKLKKLVLADFIYAKALSDNTGNKVTGACWGAWVDLLTKQQQELKDSAGNVLTQPDPHLITDVEKLSELIQSLQQGGPIQVGCGAFADAMRMSVRQLIGGILSGGVLAAAKLTGVP